ncbi:MAG: DUF4254 domain-containing protein [Edaphobacter sp.]|uniref:DUF4254 domain-containing protein n=1 Tax=Edaphobacter sp. TaxID=1934404 RepID=UPI0023874BC3|nr:DUF4254 domain-containing protein [Edaphobacter sp.]MDE1178429.1 DUF4254 domain-containing protein [Edaphobacter sp.]
MLDALSITALHDQTNQAWHQIEANLPPGTEVELRPLIEQQHRANFELWHEEDKAREPEATDAAIATVKHAIDRLNQRRNDLVEQIDVLLLKQLQPIFDAAPSASLHSETPGMMIDRLSILSLKIFHTREEAQRETATEEHREKNRRRLALLLEQREDLATALNALHQDMSAGKRRFKLYRQMKMYNDPELNPLIYKHHSHAL